jgi:hypothetical protein
MSTQTARELIDILQYEGVLRDSISKILGPVLASEGTAELAPVYDQFLNRILTKTDILGAVAEIYDDLFTEAELKQIIEFYSTTAGVKLIINQTDICLAVSEALADKVGELRTGLISL